ncbi:FxsA family protein [Modestobacter sp. VKM Ac-2978]|uniref:FxsA family protein n=1 Tax=Modestobacter sp. VKM Ac-2978 TaxID=3004132 RepID=UPI0022AAD2FA|nr:FxsA family protein [Modestobacter sp. VKM Ac-2978]MCZ2850905.1 FxsA family protein [Modestobacter sp. VKM Ac-2978]
MATSHTAPRRRSSGLRMAIGLGALAEVVVYVLVASWIGLGWTILATLATSALGWALLARQGTKALGELRLRAEEHRAPGRALGDAGLVALGGLLMVLPGFLGDLLGLLCLLPATRALPRALITRGLLRRLPDRLRGPVYVRSTRTEPVAGPDQPFRAGPASRVIEGEVAPERTDP